MIDKAGMNLYSFKFSLAIGYSLAFQGGCAQTIPCASIALATFTKPAMFAPFT